MWNIIPSKAQIGDIICSPIVGRAVKNLLPNLTKGGLSLELASDELPLRAAAALRFGLIERAERRVLKSVLPRDLPVIELGAGYGSVTLAIAEHIDQNCPIMIVEANPAVSAWWRRNIEKSQRKNIRFMEAAAVGASSAVVRFVLEPGLLGSRVVDDDSVAASTVQAVSIQNICLSSGFGRFSLVCDIEGAEFSLLDDVGAGQCLSSCDAIVMEIHPAPGRETEKLVALFASYGLRHVETQNSVFGFRRWGPC